MVLDEEKNKYKEIKHKLVDYKKELIVSRDATDNISDPELAFALRIMYERILLQYEKNKDKPYFAKLIFNQEGQEDKTIAYIGRIGFTNMGKDDIIIDWRAPIAELYYNSKIGETSFNIENKKISGFLELKRQIVFKDGEIISANDLDNSISSDEFLLPYLTNSADNRLKNIIATIQQEQDEIIRIPIYKNIVVQGVAGSGKTTVALHRLSYMIYNYRKNIKAENYYIVSPNNVFKQYISALLEDLDADLAQSNNCENLLLSILNEKLSFLKKDEQYKFLKSKKIDCSYLAFKGSKEYQKLIDRYIEDFERETFCKDFVLNGITVLSAERMFNLYKTINLETVQERAELWAVSVSSLLQNSSEFVTKLNDKFFAHEITLKQKQETERELEKGVVSKLRGFFKLKSSVFGIYKKFVSAIDKLSEYENISILKKETTNNLSKMIVSYDDIGGLLYLATKLYKYDDCINVKHILIDEAQDFSYLMYLGLKRLFRTAHFSIFGDIAQAIYSYQSIQKWDEILPIFEDSETIYLAKSYRTTIEIMQKANEILKLLDLPSALNVIRHGQQVETILTKDIKQTIYEQIEDFNNSEFYTLAVICKDDEELEKAKQILDNPKIKCFGENDIMADAKISMITVQTAKGLEFDQVIIFNENSYDKKERYDLNTLYVAFTRALHKLVINQYKN